MPCFLFDFASLYQPTGFPLKIQHTQNGSRAVPYCPMFLPSLIPIDTRLLIVYKIDIRIYII